MKALAPEQKVLSYVKAFFDYHPYDDSLCPCPEAGLAFQYGDILAIVNQDDPNWWQVRIILNTRWHFVGDYTGAQLVRVRRVLPHPLRSSNGCGAPVAKF